MSIAAKNRKSTTKGKKMIHKSDERKYVSIEDLEDFLKDGWLLGPTDKDRQRLKNQGF